MAFIRGVCEPTTLTNGICKGVDEPTAPTVGFPGKKIIIQIQI
jgi:hypothetical protein